MNRALTRTGFGFDAHSFGSAKPLVLGGLRFPAEFALKGHSDGDVLIHALIDALLGSTALGDIGDYFPDHMKKFKGISSLILLKKTLQEIRKAGWKPYSLDITVVADVPKLSNVKMKIRKLLAKNLGLSHHSIGLKAKTSEGTRLLAPEGGIAVWAVAVVVPVKTVP